VTVEMASFTGCFLTFQCLSLVMHVQQQQPADPMAVDGVPAADGGTAAVQGGAAGGATAGSFPATSGTGPVVAPPHPSALMTFRPVTTAEALQAATTGALNCAKLCYYL
jgi:hypothetical protein